MQRGIYCDECIQYAVSLFLSFKIYCFAIKENNIDGKDGKTVPDHRLNCR